MEKPQAAPDSPLMQDLLGKALVDTGIKHSDLSMVREGKQHQAEAAARGKPTPESLNSPPRR